MHASTNLQSKPIYNLFTNQRFVKRSVFSANRLKIRELKNVTIVPSVRILQKSSKTLPFKRKTKICVTVTKFKVTADTQMKHRSASELGRHAEIQKTYASRGFSKVGGA